MSEILKFYKLPRTVLTFNLFRVLGVWLVGVVPTWFLSRDLKLTLVLAVILLVFGVIIFFVSYLEYSNFSLELGAKSLTVKSGIIIKKNKTIAFDLIQSLDINYDPLIKIFDLVRVKIWTSSPQQINLNSGESNNQSELYFYLSSEDAEVLKQMIVVK